MEHDPGNNQRGWRTAPHRFLSIWQNATLRTRLRHITHLLSGNAVSLVLGIASMAITVRALGPTSYGILALTISFAQAIERIISFQSWQPIIRYGAELDGEDNLADFKRLLKFGLMLDIAASLAAWLLANLLLLLGIRAFGWDSETILIAQLYSVVLLFGLAGMPTAVLRLAGRFRATAYTQVFAAGVRLMALTITYIAEGGLLAFTLVWAGTQILSSLSTLAVGLFVLRRQGVRGLLFAPLTGITQRFSGLWRFTWSANLSLTIWSSPQQLDTLIVGALSTPDQAGFYHIAKRISIAVLQAATQVQAVMYPDLARLWARDAFNELRLAVRQVEYLLAGVGICGVAITALVAFPVIDLAMGPAFRPAAPLLIVQMIAVVMTVSGSITRSALLAMGQQQQVLRIVTASTIIFGVTVLALVPQIGAMGANLAHIALAATWLAGLRFAFGRAFRNAAIAHPATTRP